MVPKRIQFYSPGYKVPTHKMTDPSKMSPKTPDAPDRDPKTFDKKALPDKIGTSLRDLYDEVLNEDVPDDFLNLLRKADDNASRGGDSK